MKSTHFLTLLIIICAIPGSSTAHAQFPGPVMAWGEDAYGQTTVPVAAQSGVTANAAASPRCALEPRCTQSAQ